MEQNARRNNGPVGAVAPKLNANRSAGNLEAQNNRTRRNNGNVRRNNSRRNNSNAISVGSDPHELEEVVVTEPPAAPPNTVVNVNRPTPNNGRITVVATNEQAPLPPNTTPEGEEQVGGAKRRKSRRSKRKSRKSRK